MLSLIVGLVAVGLFLATPISRLLFPHLQEQQRRAAWSEPPQLNTSLLAMDGPDDMAADCGIDTYGSRILSREPLVVYLEGFLSLEERRHLLEISEPLFESSTIFHYGNATHRDTTVRDSSVALLPRTNTVRCIEARARALQGWRKDVWIERLRTQRYTAGGHYNHHFDWSASFRGWGRVSSFMVWVDADEELEGGGTDFPLLETRGGAEKGNQSAEWCRIAECGRGDARLSDEADGLPEVVEEVVKGTTFKAVPGNAVYWENFAPDGRGYEESWHAGLPVRKGVKIGLNIWSFGRIE